eukprot:7695561-Pyramimonas_sp.AAC.1
MNELGHPSHHIPPNPIHPPQEEVIVLAKELASLKLARGNRNQGVEYGVVEAASVKCTVLA